MLKEGEMVVHSTFGVGRVVRTEEMEILGKPVKLSSVEFTEADGSNFEFKLNPEKLDSSPVRRLIEREQVDAVFDRLKTSNVGWSLDANRRRRACEELIRTGDVYHHCDLIAGLLSLSQRKTLTTREQFMLDRAVAVLVEELSCVTLVQKDDLREQILTAA